MNLENRISQLTSPSTTVSAGGHNYWQPVEPAVTITERAEQVSVLTHKLVTHRVTVVAVVIVSLIAVVATSYVQVSQYRENAYHTKLQRESRIVTL